MQFIKIKIRIAIYNTYSKRHITINLSLFPKTKFPLHSSLSFYLVYRCRWRSIRVHTTHEHEHSFYNQMIVPIPLPIMGAKTHNPLNTSFDMNIIKTIHSSIRLRVTSIVGFNLCTKCIYSFLRHSVSPFIKHH